MTDDDRIPHADLVADVRQFADAVESIHPDPYQRCGGRIAFYRRLQSTLDDLPESGLDEWEFRRRLSGVAALVRDNHTRVRLTGDDRPRYPVRLRVIGEDLYVDAAPDDGELVGARLAAVEGVPVAELRERQRDLEGADNGYGNRFQLAETLHSPPRADFLFGRRATERTFTFERPDGSRHERTFSPEQSPEGDWTEGATLDRPSSHGEPAYRLLADGATAWLHVPEMGKSREPLELFRSIGHGRLFEINAADDYRTFNPDSEVPDDPEKLMAGVPSALETFRELADEMAREGTDRLLVDLRDNGGGSGILANLLLYVLYGWDGVATAEHRRGVARYSEKYFQEYEDESLEGVSEGQSWPHRIGDYGFDDGERPPVPELRDRLNDHLQTFAELEGEDEPYAGRYRPETVAVLTSPVTASAALILAAALAREGATVVGVPPGQSPQFFGELSVVELRNSGVETYVPRSRVDVLPGGPDDVLPVDLELTYDRWRSRDFGRDAALELALDRLSATHD